MSFNVAERDTTADENARACAKTCLVLVVPSTRSVFSTPNAIQPELMPKGAARTTNVTRNLSAPHSVLREFFNSAGLSADGLVPVKTEPLIEWILYEEDGNRQSLPRNPSLRDPALDSQELFCRYVQHLEGLSAPAGDTQRSGYKPTLFISRRRFCNVTRQAAAR